MIALKVWEKSEGTGNSVVVGTVGSIAGKNGTWELTSDRNFKGKSLVSIKVMDKNGASALLICADDISKDLRATRSLDELNDVLDELETCDVAEKLMQKRDRKTNTLLFDEDDEPIMEEVYFINRGSAVDMSSTRRTVKGDKAPTKSREFNWDERIAGL